MNQDSADVFVKRKRIINLSEQVLAEYKEMEDELSELDEWEWENDFDFTILGLMEIFSSHVGGYASQIATRGTVREPEHAVKFLESKYLFDQPYFVDWYFSPDNNYIKIKQYINRLDHLRLMLIEYLTRYQRRTTLLATQRASNGHLQAGADLLKEPELIVPLWQKSDPVVLSPSVKSSISEDSLVPSP